MKIDLSAQNTPSHHLHPNESQSLPVRHSLAQLSVALSPATSLIQIQWTRTFHYPRTCHLCQLQSFRAAVPASRYVFPLIAAWIPPGLFRKLTPESLAVIRPQPFLLNSRPSLYEPTHHPRTASVCLLCVPRRQMLYLCFPAYPLLDTVGSKHFLHIVGSCVCPHTAT